MFVILIFFLFMVWPDIYIIKVSINNWDANIVYALMLLYLFLYFLKYKPKIKLNNVEYFIFLTAIIFLKFLTDVNIIYIKYISLILLFILMISIQYDFTFLLRGYERIAYIFVVITLLQYLLVHFAFRGDLGFTEYYDFTDYGRANIQYSNPFYMGYYRIEDIIFNIFDIDFRRANSFTSEPKFISHIVIISFSIFLLLNRLNYFKLTVYLLSILAIGSFTSFSVLTIAILSYIALKKFGEYNLNKIFLFGILIFILSLVIISKFDNLGYISERAISGLNNFLNLNEEFNLLTIFGYPLDRVVDFNASIAILTFYMNFGIVGTAVILIMLYRLINLVNYCFQMIDCKSKKIGLLILFYTFIFYNFLYLPEVISPLFIMIYLITTILIKNLKSKVVYVKTNS